VRIGIAGATGFLGSYLIEYLTARQCGEIRGIARTLPFPGSSGDYSVGWHQGDLMSAKVCEDFIDGLDAIVYLAHTNTPLTSDQSLPSDGMANLLPILTLLQAIREKSQKLHLIYASSGGAVYGRSRGKRPFRESDTCEPGTSYGIQKFMTEHYLRMAAEKQWLTATCLRIGNPYGVLLPPGRRQGLIGVALNQIYSGKPIEIYGNPENVRDYLHLDDMCRMFEKVLEPNRSFDVFNVGTGRGYSVNQILDLLQVYSGRSIERREEHSGTSFSHLPEWVVLDISKAEKELDWHPLIDLETGLESLCRKQLLTG
jgi:UDP-glucose 4-epimerase